MSLGFRIPALLFVNAKSIAKNSGFSDSFGNLNFSGIAASVSSLNEGLRMKSII